MKYQFSLFQFFRSKKSWCGVVAESLDLDLLQDLAFLSMCVGMAIALASDMSFSLMLPFILGDYNYNTQTTAIVQSVVGVADIVSRLLTPFILRKSNLSARVAYLCSLISIIITRFCKNFYTFFFLIRQYNIVFTIL